MSLGCQGGASVTLHPWPFVSGVDSSAGLATAAPPWTPRALGAHSKGWGRTRPISDPGQSVPEARESPEPGPAGGQHGKMEVGSTLGLQPHLTEPSEGQQLLLPGEVHAGLMS